MRACITEHSSRLVALALAPAVATAFGLTACSSTANPPAGTTATTSHATATTSAGAAPTTASTAPSTTASVEIGNTINYGSLGTTASLDCADGKSLNVGGSSNTLTVTGTCETVTITGMTNNVTFDKINNHLTVLGLNNTVTYKDGSPKVDNLGSGNTVNKG
jgi:hypothetical protein